MEDFAAVADGHNALDFDTIALVKVVEVCLDVVMVAAIGVAAPAEGAELVDRALRQVLGTLAVPAVEATLVANYQQLSR
jgi:hypothetical protein